MRCRGRIPGDVAARPRRRPTRVADRTSRVTRWPSATRASTRAVPMSPEEPVTRTCIPAVYPSAGRSRARLRAAAAGPGPATAARTNPAKASGWVRWAPCAGTLDLHQFGVAARGRTSQPTAWRWWGSEPCRARTRRARRAASTSNGASSIRMAASSAASAAPSARRARLVRLGQPVPRRVAHHAPEEPLGHLARILVGRGGAPDRSGCRPGWPSRRARAAAARRRRRRGSGPGPRPAVPRRGRSCRRSCGRPPRTVGRR